MHVVDVDVPVASKVDDTVAWYENSGRVGYTPRVDFTRHIIKDGRGQPFDAAAADLDGVAEGGRRVDSAEVGVGELVGVLEAEEVAHLVRRRRLEVVAVPAQGRCGRGVRDRIAADAA